MPPGCISVCLKQSYVVADDVGRQNFVAVVAPVAEADHSRVHRLSHLICWQKNRRVWIKWLRDWKLVKNPILPDLKYTHLLLDLPSFPIFFFNFFPMLPNCLATLWICLVVLEEGLEWTGGLGLTGRCWCWDSRTQSGKDTLTRSK